MFDVLVLRKNLFEVLMCVRYRHGARWSSVWSWVNWSTIYRRSVT